MLGSFRQLDHRLTLPGVTAATLADALLRPAAWRQWAGGAEIAGRLGDRLVTGNTYSAKLGLIEIHHRVERVSPVELCLLLGGAIDGYHEWSWGEGWLRSHLEGVSLLPLAVGHRLQLWQLQRYLHA